MLNLIPIWARLAGAAVLIAGMIAGGWAIVARADSAGYQRATLEWTLREERLKAELAQLRADEIDRQQSINAMAKAAEEAELEALRIKLASSQALNIQLADEAAADPNHDNIAFDAAAVDRHIRRNQ